MVNVTIYSRKDCSICNIAKETLVKLQREFPFSLTEIDIEKDRQAYEKYKYMIPVIEIDGKEVFNYTINEDELKKLLKLSSQPR